MKRRVRAGIAGAGFIGAVHIEALRRLGYVDVAALADVSGAREKADALGVPRGYADYREMLDKEHLDVLHICTPNDTHLAVGSDALEHGVHILCEKPMTKTLAEAEALARLAREKGLLGGMNFMYRFYPNVMEMRDMVQGGEAGRIYTVHGSYLQDWLYYDTDYSWRLDSAQSGQSRAFADIGSHWIDMVEWITGQRVTEVLADFETFHKTRKKPLGKAETFSNKPQGPGGYEEVDIDTEDYAAVLFRFSGGAHGSCVISQVYGGRKNQAIVSVGGSQCALHWDSEEVNTLWIGKRESANRSLVRDPALLHPNAAAIAAYPGGHAEGFGDAVKQNFSAFYQNVLSGGALEPLYATLEDGMREMRICEKIIESARGDRWVTL